jgi:hypothetical protein
LSAPAPRAPRLPAWPALLVGCCLLAWPAGGTARAAEPAGRLFVLMINGGGARSDNFASHLTHLRELSAHLLRAGVPPEQITILSSDGSDPAPDFAQRLAPPPGIHLLDGTVLEKLLAEPFDYANSTVPGMKLLPATRPTLTRWLRLAHKWMQPADTLFIYVTDHGQDDERDPLRNEITLWGGRAGISVRQLASELGNLPAGMRVVTVMSQCFSGGFALLDRALPQATARTSGWQGPYCGYFATSSDRPAYGCFPESSAGDRMGHAFTFIDALAGRTRLPDVHAEVLVADRSPDVPMRTSDLYLAEVLTDAARIADVEPEVLGDRLLAGPGSNPPPELGQAIRVAKAYQFGSAPTLMSLRSEIDRVGDALDRLSKQQTQWDETSADANRAQLQSFMAANPRWRTWLRPQALRRLKPEVRRKLTAELLVGLGNFVGDDPALAAQAKALLDRADRTATLAYQMEIREAAWMRMRILLTSAAARIHLALVGTPEQRKRLADLDACEALTLPAPSGKSDAASTKPPAPAPKFPTPAEDQSAAQRLQPSWIGIAFRAAPASLRRRLHLAEGAALVTSVVPQSPAASAGVMPGDIVVGEKSRPFTRPNEVRAFTMLAPAGKPTTLDIIRKTDHQPLAVTPVAAP